MLQREKQYAKYKVYVAVENVYEHRIEKMLQSDKDSLVVKDKKEARKIKTRQGIDRLVEDLIQESMSRGEFDNLSGAGKPLKPSIYNPYVDFVTHKMNQIMVDNGFVPDWITLRKEIKEEMEAIKGLLLEERRRLGPVPLSAAETTKWNSVKEKLAEREQLLNSKINKFNLLVPLLDHQMLYLRLDKLSQDILEQEAGQAKNSVHLNTSNVDSCAPPEPGKNGLLSLLSALFASR